ncbi:MAG: hypothetical protein JJT78_12575 [Leptospira sp.]|nr:hypothetical protein [Leptospira sp.]
MNQYREEFGFDTRDWIIASISVIIFLVALIFFVFETVVEEKSDREVVGTVIYRNRVAQKRYSNSVIWQDVQQKEEVRNLDSIRTDERAEAILILNRGTRIELDPLSMIVISVQDEESNIILERGSIFIDPGEKDTVRVQKEKKSFLNFQSILRIFGDDSDRVLVYSEGKVTLEELGNSVAIKPNTITQVDNTVKEMGESINLLEPLDNARYFVNDYEQLNIQFRWDNSNGENVKFIIGSDPFFKNIVQSSTLKSDVFSLKLDSGNYYWKVESDQKTSMPRRIRIKTRSKLVIFSPMHKEKIYIDQADLVPFQWNELESLESYKLEISKDESFKNIEKVLKSGRNGISVKIDPGNYFVRVVGVGAIPGIETRSSISEFEVLNIKNIPSIQKEIDDDINEIKKVSKIPTPTPIPIYPKSTIDMAGKSSLVFRWKGIVNFKEYEFTLNEEKSGGKVLIRKNVTGNQYKLDDLTILDIGSYSWQVKALKSADDLTENSAISPKAKFRIILSEDLEAPELDF